MGSCPCTFARTAATLIVAALATSGATSCESNGEASDGVKQSGGHPSVAVTGRAGSGGADGGLGGAVSGGSSSGGRAAASGGAQSTQGGNFGTGGGAGHAGAAGSPTTDAGTSGDAGQVFKRKQSCNGLDMSCGPMRDADCCASTVVHGGTFNRGNDAQYPATVSDFELDTYEVTVGRFRRFVEAYQPIVIPTGAGADPHTVTAGSKGWIWGPELLPADRSALVTQLRCNPLYETWTDVPDTNETKPINCVNWYVAFAFCVWDGARLPTEAEWNDAAAGGSEQRLYPWGAAAPSMNAALAVYGCYYGAIGKCTGVSNIATVGSAPGGNGRWGQSDLAGNVAEWAVDSYNQPYDPYELPCNDCGFTTYSGDRVLRGGSFRRPPSAITTSLHDGFAASAPDPDIGVRCARDP